MFKIAGTLAFVYTIGFIGGLLVSFLRLTGRIKIVNQHYLLPGKYGTFVVSNHPSLLETVILPLLYFPAYLFDPLRYSPWCTPDKYNFYRPLYFRWLSLYRTIFIDRMSRGEDTNDAAVDQMVTALENKESVIIFGEGGRTAKSKEIRLSPIKKRRLGLIRRGLEKILRRSECAVVPVWVEGADKVLPIGSIIPQLWRSKITIHIGRPITSQRSSAKRIENALLALADKT